MKKKVLVIGSLNMDLSVRLENLPMLGETVLGKSLSYMPGGKGANQACALGKLGADVYMLGCVGDDSFGQVQKETLHSCGVDISRLKTAEEEPTGTAVIYVDDKGDNSIVVIPAANSLCDPFYLYQHEDLFTLCDYVILQMEIPYESIEYAVKLAKSKGKTVIFNPAPAARDLPDDLLANIDYLTPNETELMKLSGLPCDTMKGMEEACRHLLNKGVQNIIVTLGEAGAMWVNEESISRFGALKVQAVDTTAAGDCFNGAFVAGLAEGKSVADSIAFASKAAAICVTGKGAIASLPSRKELEAFHI